LGLLPAALAAYVCNEPPPPSPAIPGKVWATAAAKDVGVNEARLDGLRELVGGRGCIIRHGRLAYSWGDIAKRADVASACKPIFTHFLLLAIEDGKLKSVDDSVMAFEPRLKELNADLGHKDRGITWRHLANQTSGYGVREKPGEAFDYSDFNMALFPDVLFLKVHGRTWDDVDAKLLRPRLADPLQCEDSPTLLAFGKDNRPGRLAISVRDFARIGLLYLRNGEWHGKQLIGPEHVKLATRTPLPAKLPRTQGQDAAMIASQRSIGGGKNQTDHFGSYSFAWWTNGLDRDGKRHWPDAPADTFAALGHSSKRALIIIPSLDLVVSWNDTRMNGREDVNRALKALVEAVEK
jgi:CubicO group peptidase (beta-lactamase class C family)